MSLTPQRFNPKRKLVSTQPERRRPKLRRDPGPDKNVISDDVAGVFADAAMRDRRQRSAVSLVTDSASQTNLPPMRPAPPPPTRPAPNPHKRQRTE